VSLFVEQAEEFSLEAKSRLLPASETPRLEADDRQQFYTDFHTPT
jgi:hypothetical protein